MAVQIEKQKEYIKKDKSTIAKLEFLLIQEEKKVKAKTEEIKELKDEVEKLLADI